MTTANQWRILVVDDQEDICRQVSELLDGKIISGTDHSAKVEWITTFDDALVRLDAGRFDLLILDVRVGSHTEKPDHEAGIRTLEDIQKRAFIPIIFYTALPDVVQHLMTPLVQIVAKTAGGAEQLLQAVKSVVSSKLPQVNRALIKHLETVQRDYMWEFVAKNWDQLGSDQDKSSLVHLLARRLALSLSMVSLQELARELGYVAWTDIAENCAHPIQYYILPPLNRNIFLAGDLFKGKIGEREGYWSLLTPSCDLVSTKDRQPKAQNVLFARCLLLQEQEEFTQWKIRMGTEAKVDGTLKSLLKNRREGGQEDRFYILPGALTIPYLVVDLQQLCTLPFGSLNTLTRVASLDSPFAEVLLAQLARYFGRLGTPDLDIGIAGVALYTLLEQGRKGNVQLDEQ